MNSKLICKLLVVFGLLCGDSFAMSYRHALQIPEAYIGEINDFAKNVNTFPVLELGGVGSYLEKEDSVVCAFSKNRVGMAQFDTLVDEITRRFSNKEIILTGYGEAAQCAAAVASRLSIKPLGANQLKLITFCGEGSFDRLNNMYLSCKLNFSHRFASHDYQNSPFIELPLSLSSELFAGRSVLVAITGGVVGGIIGGCCCTQDAVCAVPLACVGAACGAVATTIGVLRGCPSEYLSSRGVRSAFAQAQRKAWGAETEEEWRSLGK